MIDASCRVVYLRTSELVQRLQAARQNLQLPQALTKLDRYGLLIRDDLSYVRKDQAETSVLFELIAERYGRRSIRITANQPFSGGDNAFPRSRHYGRRHRQHVLRIGRRLEPTRVEGAKVVLAHQPLHARLAHPMTAFPQVPIHPRRAIGRFLLRVYATPQPQQLRIGQPFPIGRAAAPPGPIPDDAHPQRRAHRRQPKALALRVYPGVLLHNTAGNAWLDLAIPSDVVRSRRRTITASSPA